MALQGSWVRIPSAPPLKKEVIFMMYVQCELRRGNVIDVSWIEEKFAILQNKIRRKNEEDVWEDGWIVTAIFGKVSETHIKKMKDLYKHHRKGTDV